jgi:hypothetical protein
VKNSFGMMAAPSAEAVNTLWRGSIDMHIHPAPDPSTVRRLDAVECALSAQTVGMRAIVIKSFFYPTTVVAQACKYTAPEISVYGSIVIGDATTGGLEYAPTTIETHAKIGCKVLWFPAFDAEWCRKGLGQSGGINILDQQGNLKPQIADIIKLAKDYDMVLCSGHMSFVETKMLFAEAVGQGVKKMVVTHPLVETWPPMSMEEMLELADMGAYIEHCYGLVLPRNGSYNPRKFVDAVKKIGAERTILSTDLAQITDCTPAEGMRSHIAMMLQFGCSYDEVERMAKKNPAYLLGLK